MAWDIPSVSSQNNWKSMKLFILVFVLLLVAVVAIVMSRRNQFPVATGVQGQGTLDKKALQDADVNDFLVPYQPALQATKRQVANVTLETMKNDDVFTSKVGGIAYWPEGEPYPADSNGKPLFLLAQIRFDEMPAMPGYPDSGIVQFFIADTDYYGANFDGKFSEDELQIQKDFRVKYWPKLQKATQNVAMRDSDTLPHDPKKPRRMTFRLQDTLISSSDFRFDGIFGGDFHAAAERYAATKGINSDDLSEKVWERFGGSGHKIGGYPFFTQTDPRSKPGLELLLQLDSDDEMMWGDVGVSGFFISPDDLQRRDFSRVLYNWDCH